MKNPQRAKQVKKIKRIRKWKKRSLVILCAFIFLICFLWVLIYTSLGIKIVTGILEKVMPEIKIEHASGALNDLEIQGFSLDMDGVEVFVGKAELSLSGLCLIEGKICIKNLNADDIVVNIKTDAFPESESSESPATKATERLLIKMPLPLELRNAELSNVGVNVDDMHFGLSSFKGSATWVNERIYVFPSTAMDVKAIFPDSPDDIKIPEPTKESQSISDTINDLFNKPLIASLPEVNIPLDIYVNSLKGSNWLLHMGGEDYLFNDVIIQANTENNLIKAKLVQTEARSPYANASVKVKGQIKLGGDWPISTNIEAKTEFLSSQIATEVSSNIEGQLLGALAIQTKIKGLNQVDINAKIDFVQKYMPVTARIKGNYIQWPIIGKPEYKLNNFDVDLSGSVKSYHLNAKGDFYGNELPAVQFAMQSSGTNELIDIKNITASLPQGEFDLSGKLSWLDKLKWDTNVVFRKVDLTKEIPNYPIKLDGRIITNGELKDQHWLANLTDVQLNGEINGAPLQASGNVSVNFNQFIAANDFNVKWGDNLVKLNGSTKQGDLIVDLNMPDLKVIEKNLRGKITGQMTVNGSVNKPIINSNLNVNNFIWQDMFIEHATLTGKIKYIDVLQADIELKANRFEMPNVAIKNANIVFSGDEQKHHLTINVDGKPVSASVNLDGSLNKARTKWNGVLSDAVLALNSNNRWQLNKPIKVDYEQISNLAKITAHCWVNNQSKICLDKDVTLANKGEATVSLNDIDLELFKQFNESETNLAGLVHGKVNIKWDSKYKIPTIVANINSHDVYVKQRIASQVLPIPFDLFTMNANINDKQAKLDWKFSIKEFGKFNGNVQIDDPMDKKRLSGQLIIDKLSLAIINPLLDNNEHASGIINSQLKFSGTLLDPYIVGNLDLEHSEIKSTQLPVDVQSMMIDVDFLGKSSVLKGKMQTKEGIVDIEGKADWQNIDNWKAYVTVKGAAIQVSIPPLLTMSVIPDVRIEANQDQLDLTGKVTIPKANIKVESLPPSTIDVSSDEVMLDNNLQEIVPQNFGMKINSRVLVSLGKDVAIDAFGLAAKLKGNVYVTQTNRGTTVNGQITVPEGRFHAYGQDLIVRKGDIIFAGPADQPRLNIEAIRNPESIEDGVTAGIRVTGLADDPKVEIFSDPAMSQQEALSYLLRGQGLNSGEQSDNDMLTALLIGLGTAQTGNLVGNIGDTFGIRNLTLDTQGVGDSQKVVVSGYILPHLQLKYGVGIFDSLATFTLRYRLLPRLYLEAASGLDQTVDLIYQFEF